MRDGAGVTARGRVQLTPELEAALTGQILEAVEPLREAGKLGGFLLQMTPGFSPKRNELAELEPLVSAFAPHRLALELRNRRWVDEERIEQTLDWFEDQHVAFVCVDSPPGDATTIMPGVDAATRDDLAYLRMHGRDTQAYLSGKTVAERFGWIYGDDELEEIAARAKRPGRAGRRGARVLQQQPRRRRAHRGAALPVAAGPGPRAAARGRPAIAGVGGRRRARGARGGPRPAPSAARAAAGPGCSA